MQSKCPIKRRSMRLLNAIHELHKQGYQNLACYCYMSPSGFNWRLELKHFDDLYEDDRGEIKQLFTKTFENPSHSSGEHGNEYFGWSDASSASARQLAELIKNRFPRLLEQCKGINFKYAGWFTYLIGEAENEKLPLFFLEYNNTEKGKIFSTKSNEKLIAPPHAKIQSKRGFKWLWDYSTDISEDWHTAYRPIIDAIRPNEINRYPKYPSHSKDTIQHGAYWEGAIYYLRKKMGYSSEHEYIHDRVFTNTRWQEFDIIYNSQGQIHLFDAHMARVALSRSKDRMSAKLVNECKKSLSDIKLMYQENEYPYPNPYWGGNNPLHLAYLDGTRLA